MGDEPLIAVNFRPFDRELAHLSAEDLERIVSEAVEEGLFLEYKSEWVSQKFARACASFANNQGGGTVIVGIRADKLVPIKVVGVETANPGELEERAVQTIRQNIAPVPSSYRLRAVDVGGGRACLVAEVEEGLQPPYLFTKTGQVFIRTSNSSEPLVATDREAIDRLFAAGARGRAWASQEIANRVGVSWTEPTEQTELFVVPAVADGLAANALIFRENFVEQLETVARGWWISASAWSDGLPATTQDFVQWGWRADGETFVLRVDVSGIVQILWERPDVQGLETLKTIAEEILGRVRTVYEEMLGYRGEVVLGLYSFWMEGSKIRRVRIRRGPLSLDNLGKAWLWDSVKREMFRALGRISYDPAGGYPAY